MMRFMILISCLCVATLAACEGSSDPPPLARRLFDENVEPLLASNCVDCHSNPNDTHHAPDYLDVVPGDHYASLVSRKDFVSCDVENSLLLQKGLEPDHPGGRLTDAQHDRVEAWLLEEAIERFHGTCRGSPPGDADASAQAEPLTGRKALEDFGHCMTIADWKETGMPLVARQEAIEGPNAVPCHSCHALGTGGNWMPDPDGPDVDDAFQHMSEMYSIFKLVRWTVNDQDGSFKDIVQSHRWRDKGSDPDHPEYELTAEYQGYIDAWFQRTYDRWRDGVCAP